ncbi:hypothetical protein Q7P35_004504 [Cladosporium inversicolor]
MSDQGDEISQVTYEQLAGIEDEFEEIDTQIIKQQYTLSKPAYAKRSQITSSIPSFWPLVLETCPPEIDQFITPQDSQIFAESLTSISVSRPEIDADPKNGNPRTVAFKFEFKPNDFFTNTVLEKTFHWRRASDGFTGLVSEPVAVQWKEGKDLSEGLNGMAVKLFEARKKAGDFLKKDLKEYEALAEKLTTANAQNTSFFTWFGFVSGRRYVTAEESEKAEAEHKKGNAKPEEEEDEDEDEDEEDKDDDSVVEVHEDGEQLAISIAEDLWPGAIKYFTQAQGMDEMSDIDFEEMEMEDEDESDGEGEAIDIRALIGSKGGKGERKSSGSGAPAAKKQKK